jgi:hypothetical protein
MLTISRVVPTWGHAIRLVTTVLDPKSLTVPPTPLEFNSSHCTLLTSIAVTILMGNFLTPRTLVYSTLDNLELKLDLYLLSNATGAPSCIHGGGLIVVRSDDGYTGARFVQLTYPFIITTYRIFLETAMTNGVMYGEA